MADTKISALTAVVTPASTDQFAVNQGGVSKRMTLAQVQAYGAPKLIAGNSGAANTLAAPSETWQILTANATANSTTTVATVMTTTALAVGTYFYEYYIVWQSATTTVGVNFQVDYLGTATRHRMVRHGQTALATAADGIASSAIATNTGGVVQTWAGRADAANLGPSAGADIINVDQFEHIRGILVAGTSSDLTLRHASETATSTQVMADTLLLLKRFA